MFLDLNVFQKQLSIPTPSKRFDILLHTGHPLARCSWGRPQLLRQPLAYQRLALMDEGKRHHTSRHGGSWMFLHWPSTKLPELRSVAVQECFPHFAMPGVGGPNRKTPWRNQVVQFFRGPTCCERLAFSIWQSLRRRMETVETGSLD